jgi:hypothetical protein
MPSIRARIVFLAPMALAAALAGCSSPEPGHLSLPPGVSVQRLDYEPDGKLNAALRVQNFSLKPVTYSTLDLKLELAGKAAGEFHATVGFEIAGHASDIVQATLTATPAALATLAAAEQRATTGDGSIPYKIVGTLVAEKPKGDHKIEHDGRLSPEPGVAHHFR